MPQPWTHCAEYLIFMATREVDMDEVIKAIEKIRGVVKGSVELTEPRNGEWAEPGDPADMP